MKLVLGGGISGLAWAFYHPDYVVVGENFGGQMGFRFELGARYLHKTAATQRFLDDLKLKSKTKTVQIGYLIDSKIVRKPSQDFRKEYYMKSRRTKNLMGFDKSIMTGNRSTFKAFDISFETILRELKKVLTARGQLIEDRIIQIDYINQYIYGVDGVYRYDKLVSTINLKTFLRLCNMSPAADKLRALDITYCVIKGKHMDLKGHDYVYIADPKVPFHRISQKDGYQVLEIADRVDRKDLRKMFKGYADGVTIPMSQLSSKGVIMRLPGVRHLGRYAQWNHFVKADAVIAEAQKVIQ